MKIGIFLPVLAGILIMLFSGGTAAQAAPKTNVADFSLKSVDGSTIRLSELLGEKVIVLSFWNIACKPCRKEMPKLEELYKDLNARGLEVLAINTDGPSELPGVKPLVSRKGYTFPVLLDSEQKVVKLYNPRCILPYTVLINRDGEVVYTHIGYNTGDEIALREKIEAILSPAETSKTFDSGEGRKQTETSAILNEERFNEAV